MEKRDLQKHNNLYELKTILSGGPLRFVILIGSKHMNMFASERDKNELPDTIMAFHNDSFQILKRHCLLESSVPLP